MQSHVSLVSLLGAISIVPLDAATSKTLLPLKGTGVSHMTAIRHTCMAINGTLQAYCLRSGMGSLIFKIWWRSNALV